jgi:hypothetical protein
VDDFTCQVQDLQRCLVSSVVMEDESTVLEFAHIFLQKKNGKKKEEKTERNSPSSSP